MAIQFCPKEIVFNSNVKKVCGLKFEYKVCSFGFGSNCNNLL